jgi:hypothetical protein
VLIHLLNVNLVCFYLLELMSVAFSSSRSAVDDKRRRLRAFLTCMRSDTPLMLNPAYVPQHLLVLASVLRYVVSISEYAVHLYEFYRFKKK